MLIMLLSLNIYSSIGCNKVGIQARSILGNFNFIFISFNLYMQMILSVVLLY
uniref:Uncharacterized protein n=1 Tax=Chondria sp. (in: red algae) TaxID=1982705 RepID=A0A1Z1ME56_9FLOR|nr:hypothetical protein [Chondria sp. (in: red algae)]